MFKKSILTIILVFMITTLLQPINSINTIYANDQQKTALELLQERSSEFSDDTVISDLSTEQLQTLKQLLLTNFETSAIKLAKEDYVQNITSLSLDDLAKYFTPLVRKIRQENPNMSNQEASQEAMRQALVKANEDLYNTPELVALISDAKQLFQTLLANNLLESNNRTTISSLKSDLHALHRALFYLVQNFNFDHDLPQRLVLVPHSIKNIAELDNAYMRMVHYGTLLQKPQKDQRLNRQYINDYFTTVNSHIVYNRLVQPYTQLTLREFLTSLASTQNQDAETYFQSQSASLITTSDKVQAVLPILFDHYPQIILPLLSKGEKVYISVTSNGVNIGQLDAYIKDYPELENYVHPKNTLQDPNKQSLFKSVLNQQENYWDFVRSSTNNQHLTPILGKDTMSQYRKDVDRLVWGSATTSTAIRDFFIPAKLYDASYNPQSGFEGQSHGEKEFVSFTLLLMGKRTRGLTVFSHESTHSKEKNIFGTKRLGQGPEVYACGFFEDLDNTQLPGAEYQPVFTLNTTIEVGEQPNRTQAKKPHTSITSLQNYTHNLMELVMYMEALEAEIALEMSDDDKNIYFNQIQQVSAINDSARIANNSQNISTNDKITVQNARLNTLDDLVNNNIVAGQFIAKGSSPLTTIPHNDYVNIPMLNSFYAAPQQVDNMNTVGDVSFKRLGYEILAFKGWSAFTDYIGNGSVSDSSAFAKILNGDYDNNWSKFKLAKLKDLLDNYQLNSAVGDVENLKSSIKEGINKDLVLLKQYRSAINGNITDNMNDTDKERVYINEATKLNLLQNANNVRNAKLLYLQQALNFNELEQSVLIHKQLLADKTLLENEINLETTTISSIAYLNANQDKQTEYLNYLAQAKEVVASENPSQIEIENSLNALQTARLALNGVSEESDNQVVVTNVETKADIISEVAIKKDVDTSDYTKNYFVYILLSLVLLLLNKKNKNV